MIRKAQRGSNHITRDCSRYPRSQKLRLRMRSVRPMSLPNNLGCTVFPKLAYVAGTRARRAPAPRAGVQCRQSGSHAPNPPSTPIAAAHGHTGSARPSTCARRCNVEMYPPHRHGAHPGLPLKELDERGGEGGAGKAGQVFRSTEDIAHHRGQDRIRLADGKSFLLNELVR